MSSPPQRDSQEEAVPISDVVARLEALVVALQAQVSEQ
jgi:hypothetical protein